jgi:hypothetical protein
MARKIVLYSAISIGAVAMLLGILAIVYVSGASSAKSLESDSTNIDTTKISPVAAEPNTTAFTTKLTQFNSKAPVSESVKTKLVTAIATYYNETAQPFAGLSYERLDYEVTIDGSDNSSYRFTSNATASIAVSTGEHPVEKYAVFGEYNFQTGELNEVSTSHYDKYLPEQVANKSVESAQQSNNPVLQEFASRYGSIEPKDATFDDSREVFDLKYPVTAGGERIENKEYSFLPNSTQVIEVPFVVKQGDNRQDAVTTEQPSVIVYLEPSTFKVLGAQKVFWN